MDSVINNGVSVQKVKTDMQKCANCGADLIFDPETNSLMCQHCGSYYGINERNFTEKFHFVPQKLSDENISSQTVISKCTNCGAVTTTDSLTMSHTCPFCGSAKLTTESELRYTPDAIVPFSIKKEKINELFAHWIKKRKFVPRGFRKIKEYDSFNANYEPCWLFDSRVHTKYSGVLEYDETEEYTDSNGRSCTRTVTRRFDVYGDRDDNFKNITIYSGQEIQKKYFDKISPFNLSNIKVYSDEYLAGYKARQYTKDIKSSWKMADDAIDGMIKGNIVRSYNADRYSYLHLDKTYVTSQFAYTLLPIWEGKYTFKGKEYNIYVNGTNGYFSGEVPRNKLKIVIVVILALILFIAFVYAINKVSAGSMIR